MSGTGLAWAAWFALLPVILAPACAPDPAEPASARSEQPTNWDEELRLQQAADEDANPTTVEVSLTATIARVATGPEGTEVERWTYNGSVPGPVIRVRVGDRLRVHFRNELPEATTIHWHGLEVPAAMDGADPEHAAIAPGASFDYEFVVPHAGTYWYHPHLSSASQVWRGLYGALIVEGPDEPELGSESVLVLSDISLENGALGDHDPEDKLGAFFGHQGQLLEVNGRTLPTLRVRAGAALRLRFINAAVSRYFRLGVRGHTLVQVAGDSGFLERPLHQESILLVPGERAEAVLVPSGPAGSTYSLEALPYDRFDCGGPCEDTQELVRIELTEDGGAAPRLPERLTTIPSLDTSHAVSASLAMTQDTGEDGGGAFGLNHQLYPADPLTLHAQVGDTQVWTVENQTDYDHPFHLHGFRFQVLEQDGAAPAAAAWKDTMNVARKTQARIAVQFDDRPGMWMLHCHILDHAEIGMMGILHLER